MFPDSSNRIIEALKIQSGFCAALGSPFSASVLDLMAENVADGGAFAPLFEPWVDAAPDRLGGDAVALRALGGLHDLVLEGADTGLVDQYPPRASQVDRGRLATSLDHAAAAHAHRLARFMTSPPQTNEVRRCACLLGGFLTVAGETGLPLRCLEIGASAGLNLHWDRFRYDLGPAGRWGADDAPLSLTTQWSGPPPPPSPHLSVISRAGCDQKPIDPRQPEQVQRLQAYVWADQTQRLDILRRAISLAAASNVQVEEADAGAWVSQRLDLQNGAATVLYHSVVWQYLGDATQRSVRATLDSVGAQATRSAPLAWLRMEPTPDNRFEVRLTTWPGGEDRLLAQVHPHGATVDWLGSPG